MTRRLFVSLVVVVTIIGIAVFVRTPSPSVGEGGRGDRAGEEQAGADLLAAIDERRAGVVGSDHALDVR
jgi:hypothetical protein